ncbi:MAG: PSD1 and planctomycete cytochrome C domain-containing protein [Fimbriimonas sp.]
MKAQFPLLLASLSLLAAGILASSSPAIAEPRAPQAKALNFNRDVKPILSENCFKCHGPDAAVVMGDLRLDVPESATKDRNGKKAIWPGKPDQSLLLQRVSAHDDGMRMPPMNSGLKPLTEQQIATLRQWIASGGKYEEHWSLVAPKLMAIPKVSNKLWAANPIDSFVMARFEKEGLKPEPPADRATLIRRATLTLTGLPPTPQEIQAFLTDKKPGAYERLVDRLLASPAYGENQARYWLDAVRYGDTHGLHLDNERSIFPYRDWVVRNFNKDLPFNDFTVWQLAGDLLPNPTTEQMIATGYVRMNPTTSEGGAIEAEFLAKNTFDRVDTTSTVFLGMTVGCARCHDHKYDPITHKDYYRMFAFFNSTTDTPLDGNAFLPPPVMPAATPEQDSKLKTFDRALVGLQRKVSQSEALAWLNAAEVAPVTTGKWEVSPIYSAANFDEVHTTAFAPENPGEAVDWKPFEVVVDKISTPVQGKENSAAYLRGVITTPKARELVVRVSSDDGIKIWLNGKVIHDNKVLRGVGPLDTVKLNLNAGENAIVVKISNSGGGDGFLLKLNDELQERLFKFQKIWRDGKPEDRKPEELAGLYLETGPESAAAKEYRQLKKDKAAFEATIPMTMVAREMAKPREAFVLKRGEYDQPTDKVERMIPTSLGTLGKYSPPNRLGLARWMVSEKNPLVTRVYVNRIWQQHFGTGIVKTAEDFGSQGEFPVNLPLLDYLAITFRQQGWSTKKLHRMILTSNTFKQRASADKSKVAKDPENRFLARGPRFRLDAEVIRDASLAASGLLNREMGGRGFKPYQPDGLWEAIAFTESTTSKYVRDHGPSIYKRSIYMFLKRTSPHPVMLSFDAPMRESCIVRRSRTNTPLQALVTLNEPMFIESSRVLAEKLIFESKSDAQRINRLYMLTLNRMPSDQERTLLTQSLKRYRDRYHADLESARELVEIGDSPRDESIPLHEHAAWTLLCSTVVNTDEFLTQH